MIQALFPTTTCSQACRCAFVTINSVVRERRSEVATVLRASAAAMALHEPLALGAARVLRLTVVVPAFGRACARSRTHAVELGPPLHALCTQSKPQSPLYQSFTRALGKRESLNFEHMTMQQLEARQRQTEKELKFLKQRIKRFGKGKEVCCGGPCANLFQAINTFWRLQMQPVRPRRAPHGNCLSTTEGRRLSGKRRIFFCFPESPNAQMPSHHPHRHCLTHDTATAMPPIVPLPHAPQCHCYG